MTRVYVSTTDTAKLIRSDLKAAFPAIKFSVRSNSYANGSSIDVRWTDGPTTKEVDAVVGKYQGASFDGMTDLKSYVDHTDERGSQIHYGSDWVNTSRDYSLEFVKIVAYHLTMHYCFSSPPRFEEVMGTKWNPTHIRAQNNESRYGNYWANDFLHLTCYNTSAEQLQEMIANAG
jgi:hypothetical protein